jgi:hypothetical protein
MTDKNGRSGQALRMEGSPTCSVLHAVVQLVYTLCYKKKGRGFEAR